MCFFFAFRPCVFCVSCKKKKKGLLSTSIFVLHFIFHSTTSTTTPTASVFPASRSAILERVERRSGAEEEEEVEEAELSPTAAAATTATASPASGATSTSAASPLPTSLGLLRTSSPVLGSRRATRRVIVAGRTAVPTWRVTDEPGRMMPAAPGDGEREKGGGTKAAAAKAPPPPPPLAPSSTLILATNFFARATG